MESFKSLLKTTRGRLILVGVVLGVAVLCGLGVFAGERLPAISLAAEQIPLPFSVPLLGDHIPNTLPATWLTMVILIALSIGYHRAWSRKEQVSLFQAAVEGVGEAMLGFVESVGNENVRLFFPLVATFFLFIAVSNWCGILPGFGSVGVWVEHHHEMELIPFLRSANAHLSTTLALAIVSVGATQYYGFKVLGTSFIGRYINFRASSPKPDPETTPGGFRGVIAKVAYYFEIGANGFVGILETILEVIKVLPFSFRLFGNIVAGEVLLFVVSYLFAYVFPVIFLGLELFVGVIQALIFAMLTLVFMSVATSHGHGGEEGAH
ncbi:MAG: FoF1 ATP synthase subunit a [Anaerolineae bacterium]|jgi:F-type H+-transporting ATPase subunit a